MNQEQVIYLLNAIILAMVGVIIIQQAKKKEAKKIFPIIRREITPVVIQFESDYYTEDANNRGLLPGERDWQIRREICSRITSHLFSEFMKTDSELIEVSRPPYSKTITAKIYILPINEQ